MPDRARDLLLLLGLLALPVGAAAADGAAGSWRERLDALRAALPGDPQPFADTMSVEALHPIGGSSDLVAVEGMPFARARRLQTLERSPAAYNVQLMTPSNAAPIAAGDTLYAVFDARCEGSSYESGEGQVQLYIQRPAPSWHGLASVQHSIGSDWKRYHASAVADRDYPPGSVNVVIQQGMMEQTILYGEILLFNLGPGVDRAQVPRTEFRYQGMEPDAPWRAEAEARIERHRKGDFSVEVVDTAGAPVVGAELRLEMTRHKFGFGTFVGGNDAGRTYSNEVQGRQFRQLTRDWFNKVTLPMYWADGWGWPDNRAAYLEAGRRAKADGLALRAHVLVYPGFVPKAVMALRDDPTALRQAIRDHIREILEATRELGIREWDVVNEFRHNHDVQDILGKAVMVEWFELAQQIDPSLRLYINENQILASGGKSRSSQDHYHETITYLLQQGAPLHGIGMQSHMGADLTPPTTVLSILDRFAAFGLPIQITEYDLALPDPAVQARYTADFITTVFSHPACDSFIVWGFIEDMCKPDAWLVDRSGRPRANGEAYRKLVFDRWWTRDSGRTGEGGRYATRGFFGTYRITVEHQGRSATVTHDLHQSGSVRIVLP